VNNIDQLGEQARTLREELQGASDAVSGAREEVKGYNAERKEKTAKLREILAPIVKHLQDGGTANGVTGLQNWAWWYNPTTKSPKNSLRQIMRIVKSKDKVTSSHPDKRSHDITVSLANVEFSASEAHALVEIEQSHELKYQGKRRGSDFSFAADNANATPEEYEALVKEDKAVWTHTVREVSGHVTILVENEEGTMTERQLVAALRTKMTATLKFMRLWDKKLTKEFSAFVEERAEGYEEQAKSRSRSAKKAAQTRAKKKPTVPADTATHIQHRFHSNHTLCGKKAKIAGGRQDLLALVDELKIGVPEDGDRRREIIAASSCGECKALLAAGNLTPRLPGSFGSEAENRGDATVVAAPKVKTLSAFETREAIAIAKVKKEDHDDMSVAWAEQYGKHFAEEAPKHPEWRPQQVAKEHERIKAMIYARQDRHKREASQIRIKLTEAQVRQFAELPLMSEFAGRTLLIDGGEYEDRAKQFVLALEKRRESLFKEAWEQKKTLKDWNDKSPANAEAFNEQRRLQGAMKACEGAISAIVYGAGDREENICDWYEQHRDEINFGEPQMSEPAKALAAAVGNSEPPEHLKETIAQFRPMGGRRSACPDEEEEVL
jgi:hypothetical protein